MTIEIPQYCLRAYALLFSKHSTKEAFSQSELDWIVSESMKKKIFSLLLQRGWIQKQSRETYTCRDPVAIIRGLMEFRVPGIIKEAKKEYAFTHLSAVEIWSDFSYVQRGMEKSPYFIKVLRKDLNSWNTFFNAHEIPHYISSGSTIGEFVILIPVDTINYKEKNGFKVEPLNETIAYAKSNEIYAYASNYL